MKRSLTTLGCILLTLMAAAQQSPVVSLAGIGAVKIGMKQRELERLLQSNLSLKNLLDKNPQPDTVSFSWQGTSYSVVLDKSYDAATQNEFTVHAVICESPELKTKSGVAIGDDKLKIVRTYDGYTLHILPDYEGMPPVKSKTHSSVYLYDDTLPTCIIFYLENNKVVGFCVQYSEGCRGNELM
ncbi:hypothetical protein SAMN05444008_11889 [Cnuella takakiae]|uniref:Uncharacterized protein n=1 Tax=Cnuella takakiae TaxID=1302690 RepID=A0A1M5H9K0_9BACT|nr:hypothetical protein [Cnuella takakiae]OLY91062.1 hypothetical protein BUE76_03455 [Cnuella takakiae]SHG12631.1 hypothetical protein SAMN05444008_11889 [Cnuella takakiae]